MSSKKIEIAEKTCFKQQSLLGKNMGLLPFSEVICGLLNKGQIKGLAEILTQLAL